MSCGFMKYLTGKRLCVNHSFLDRNRLLEVPAAMSLMCITHIADAIIFYIHDV